MSLINNDAINSVVLNGSVILVDGDVNREGLHLNRGLSRLIEQFKDKPILNTILAIFLSELDEIESTLSDIVSQRILDNANGIQLDILGEILGRQRGGFEDDIYRKYLKLQIGINTSKGDAAKILTVWKTLTGSSIVNISENFPAGITLTADTSLTDPSILDEMQRVTAATVALSYVISNGVPFCFEGGEGLGWADVDDDSLAGVFVERLP